MSVHPTEGDRPGRSEATRADYMRRGAGLVERYEGETDTAWQNDPLRVVNWLAGMRPRIKAATFRFYRAALLEYLHGHAPREMLDGLRALSSAPCIDASIQTSATKAKQLPDDELHRIVDYLLKDRGRYDEMLALWLTCSRMTGLRPAEWSKAYLSEDGDELVVANAKFSSTRAHGVERTLDISPMGADERELLERFLDALALVMDFEALQQACRRRLREVCKKLFPRRRTHPTLYSARHQFTADLKSAGYSQTQVAALMGHRSTRSAGRHYARGVSGRGGASVAPTEDDVRRVSEFNPDQPDMTQHTPDLNEALDSLERERPAPEEDTEH